MPSHRPRLLGEQGPGELPVELVPLSKLKLDPQNARLHPAVNIEGIKTSLRRFGQRKPVVVSRRYVLVAGNGTVESARELGWDGVWATVFPGTPAEARAYAIADNHTSDLSTWDNGQLADTLQSLQSIDPELLEATGMNADYLAELLAQLEPPGGPGSNNALAERFGVPPFTVLDARSGAWRKRKDAWLALGMESELGRDPKLLGGGLGRKGQGGMSDQLAPAKKVRSGAYGAQARTGTNGKLVYSTTTGATSVFDPVLCELVYRWFSAEGHTVLDPWAGGSVRGIVASHLRRNYLGVELRPEQVRANEAQRHLAGEGSVEWLEGESTAVLAEAEPESYDLLFGCPPYYDLERYSDDPRDLSAMKHADFDAAMLRNVAAAAKALRTDSYAVFVVGNVRTSTGRLLDMRALMTRAAEAAGLHLYNDGVLLTPIGSLPVRAGKAFAASRVLGRAHQEVLVYLKGDRRRASKQLGDVDLEVSLADAAQVSPDLAAMG